MEQAFIPYSLPLLSDQERQAIAEAWFLKLDQRRSVREFSNRPVPAELITTLLKTASTSPSGAHKQPWTFCAVQDPQIKKAIREAAEKEEYENYHGRMSEAWLEDLKPFNTDWHKPFLEDAPWLIIVFKRLWEETPEGAKAKNYYVSESVGLACGMLLTAIHQVGLCALTHTPSPMNFLQEILKRPDNERPFLLIPVGYPSEQAMVPLLERKKVDEIIEWY